MTSLTPSDNVADHIAEQAIAEVAKKVVLLGLEKTADPTLSYEDWMMQARAAAEEVAEAIRLGYAAYHGFREEEADGGE